MKRNFQGKHACRTGVLLGLASILALAFCVRLYAALATLRDGDPDAFLVFPMGVILPSILFGFLATRKSFTSAEGALMQLGALVQLFFIVAVPPFALYLTLGFPVVFLAVELFETRLAKRFRDPIRDRLLL